MMAEYKFTQPGNPTQNSSMDRFNGKSHFGAYI